MSAPGKTPVFDIPSDTCTIIPKGSTRSVGQQLDSRANDGPIVAVLDPGVAPPTWKFTQRESDGKYVITLESGSVDAYADTNVTNKVYLKYGKNYGWEVKKHIYSGETYYSIGTDGDPGCWTVESPTSSDPVTLTGKEDESKTWFTLQPASQA